jgi:SAM-dependent methyltransferase
MAPHAHHHHEHNGHDGHFDWAVEAARLDRGVEVERPQHEAIVDWLAVPAGATVVDLGCGAGGMTAALARAVGDGGTVVAVDGEPEMLAMAEARVAAAASGATLRTVTADLDDPDWPEQVRSVAETDSRLVWASQVVHHLADEVAGVARLAELVAPGGGVVALAEGGLPLRWCSLDLGHDELGLQARIVAASEAWFPTMRAAIDGAVARTVPWTAVLSGLGLDVRSRSFLLDHPAPLSEAGRRYVVDQLVAAAGWVGSRLPDADGPAIDALIDDHDPAGIAHRDDAFVLSARTVHTGTRVR